MIDPTLLWFSFFQGVLAFFAPCAVALLPGYLSAFVTRNEPDTISKWQLLRKAVVLATFTIVGIALIYLAGGMLLTLFASVVKPWIPWVAIAMGALVIVLGVLMVLGKNVSLNIHGPRVQNKGRIVESFVFGIAYGIGALGCLFPLFLVVVTAALGAPFATGIAYIIAYAVGMSLFMLAFYIIAVFARGWLQRSLSKIMRYVTRVAGVLVILAGAYIIYYQSVLI